MIPVFPKFKKLELKDKLFIENFTKQYEPYSDFNFVDMWSWDIAGQMELSDLNGNLIIKTSDYYTDEYKFSFLGNNKVTETIDELFKLMGHPNVPNPELILVPEASLEGLDTNKYYLEIDLNNYDYIYDLEDLSVYPGNKFSDKRRKLNSFLRNHQNASIKLIDIHDEDIKQSILNLNDVWTKNKSKVDQAFYLPKESTAVQRFLDAHFEGLLCVGVFYQDKLIGYSVFTPLLNDYVICHFSKADITYYGVYEYLMRESAGLLLGYGVKYLNYQEDLGIPGLRFFKNSFNPCKFLRKYYIKAF